MWRSGVRAPSGPPPIQVQIRRFSRLSARRRVINCGLVVALLWPCCGHSPDQVAQAESAVSARRPPVATGHPRPYFQNALRSVVMSRKVGWHWLALLERVETTSRFLVSAGNRSHRHGPLPTAARTPVGSALASGTRRRNGRRGLAALGARRARQWRPARDRAARAGPTRPRGDRQAAGALRTGAPRHIRGGGLCLAAARAAGRDPTAREHARHGAPPSGDRPAAARAR